MHCTPISIDQLHHVVVIIPDTAMFHYTQNCP